MAKRSLFAKNTKFRLIKKKKKNRPTASTTTTIIAKAVSKPRRRVADAEKCLRCTRCARVFLIVAVRITPCEIRKNTMLARVRGNPIFYPIVLTAVLCSVAYTPIGVGGWYRYCVSLCTPERNQRAFFFFLFSTKKSFSGFLRTVTIPAVHNRRDVHYTRRPTKRAMPP